MMKVSKFNRIAAAATLGGTVFLVGCGGGGGGGASDPDPDPSGSAVVVGKSVAGPLDPVQTQLGGTVLSPLAASVSGTPLEPVVECTSAIVNGNVLDIADTVLVTLQSAAPMTGSADPQALADSLRAMVVNIVELLQGLAGEAASCSGSGSGSVSRDQLQAALHTLDGTPLAPLGTALEPVLAQIVGATGTSGTAPTSLDLTMVASLVSQLNDAMQLALTQIPASARTAPVVGGALTTLAAALDDTEELVTAASTMNPTLATAALQSLLTNSLGNLLTQLVPLGSLEDQAGGASSLTTQIQAAAASLAAAVGSSSGSAPSSGFDTLLTSQLTSLLGPLQSVLPSILTPITSALGGGAAGGTGGALAGTALAPAVNILTSALGMLLNSGGSCAFAAIPLLSMLCGT